MEGCEVVLGGAEAASEVREALAEVVESGGEGVLEGDKEEAEMGWGREGERGRGQGTG